MMELKAATRADHADILGSIFVEFCFFGRLDEAAGDFEANT